MTSSVRSMLRGLLLAGTAVLAQCPAAPPRFDTSAWNHPEPSFRIVGSIHYVGTSELAAYLITTRGGHILLDGGLPESAPLIEQSIRALGLKPEDIRVLLISQAHFDHVGSLAHFKRLSDARVEVMQGDHTLVEDGGKSDYLFRNNPSLRFEPVKVDRVLRDGDTVSLGDVQLTARLTPGHTPGSTTWVTTATEGERSYRVVFAASTSINPGTRLVDRPSYPGIVDDFRRAFAVLESLEPDIFLGAHAGFFGLADKRQKLARGGSGNPFVDPNGYRALLTAKKAAFEAQLAKERATPK